MTVSCFPGKSKQDRPLSKLRVAPGALPSLAPPCPALFRAVQSVRHLVAGHRKPVPTLTLKKIQAVCS